MLLKRHFTSTHREQFVLKPPKGPMFDGFRTDAGTSGILSERCAPSAESAVRPRE
jgi:hypothetical protein